MKINSTHFRLSFFRISLLIAAALPLPSYAEIRLPHWLDPTWIQEKLMDFHARNTERIELAQAQAKKNVSVNVNANDSGNINGAAGGNGATTPSVRNDKTQRNPSLAPVEIAVPKMNEKYLSKEELKELRKQLRQQN